MDDFHNDIDGDFLLAEMDLNMDLTINATKLDTERLCTPQLFPDFPYPNPYHQQLSLMRTLYTAAENAHCAVLESPTGTGKSLSLLTGSIRWLLDHNERQMRRLDTLAAHVKRLNETDQKTPDDWILTYEQVRLQKRTFVPEVEELAQLSVSLDEIHRLKATKSVQSLSLRKACFDDQTKKVALGGIQVLSKQQDLSSDSVSDEPSTSQDEEWFLTDFDLAESAHIEDEQQLEKPEDKNQPDPLIRIIYCSRTHSQLSQCLDELAKCSTLCNEITALRLSSRTALCTNPKVYSLTSGDMINEACLELSQYSKTNCPMRSTTAVKRLSDYLLSGGNSIQVTAAVRERRLSSIFGNLQLQNSANHQLAASRLGCPYYATRRAMDLAQLILVPYSTLLLPNARMASGLKLENSILIIDEAHNLLEATTASLSVLLSANDFRLALFAFCAYQQRYRARLAVLTALRLRQLIHMLRRLQKLIVPSDQVGTHRTDCTVVTVNQMLSQTGLDNLSMHELVAFLHQRHFIHKLAGFTKWLASKQASNDNETGVNRPKSHHIPSGMSSLLAGMKRKRDEAMESPVQVEIPTIDMGSLDASSSGLFRVQAFLQALATYEDDARVVIHPLKDPRLTESAPTATPPGSLFITVLNPGRYLRDLVRQARCVILAGGTMKPLDEYIEQVFVAAGKTAAEIVSFTCDHVIDPENQLAVFPLESWENGVQLEITYQKRWLPAVMDACGEIILQVSQHTPGGVVVFLPSYDYQNQLCSHWESTGLWDRLSRSKRVFREPRNAHSLNEIMHGYTRTIMDAKSGALLICVIGGKLSEGINFSDELARAVIIVGMPYPNPNCPLLREKMAYLDRQFGNRPSYQSISPGRQHYEALCMRAINQAIGRAVRHAKDYAAVFLVDRRFTRPSVQQKLPQWVVRSLRWALGSNTVKMSASQAIGRLDEFFASAKQYTTRD
ncbi:Chromosome transmission fidelity protein 1 [Fasciola hepatica]|uniref:Chromosome transmission fidelity protein 1 n=1 Tax=Fasciola hepatica TaxID=6192 RepID=A0A4E0R9Y6_FASHE|nr:Chromosome transmission fidelity protein 1 [Fasciola hepatica]